MYPSGDLSVRQNVALLFSQRSRDAYAREATERGETYTFIDAWGQPKTWIKGERAYLAPNGVSALLARCNLKHDWIEEAELSPKTIGGYRAILVPNAARLSDRTIDLLAEWLRTTDGRLIVTGKTNLPPDLLGLRRLVEVEPAGYTGWRWLPGSPFGDLRAWQEYYVTGYDRHAVSQVEVDEGGRALATLVEFSGDLRTAATATKRDLGPAIVTTDRTVYVANQAFELLGGMLQAHLNVERIRHWANPTHWGDTIAFFLRRLLLDVGLDRLWETRLRSFGSYDGAFSLRHDVHGMLDFSFLEYQVQNLVPASYDVEDPAISSNITPEHARQWVDRIQRDEFLEAALHNDSQRGDPPIAVHGTGLYDHVRAAESNLGFRVYTAGRHAGGHLHPETLDAMDYLYANYPDIVGLCTFSYYHMVGYGVRNPGVSAGGSSIGGKLLTYITDLSRTIATQGFWFPFHAVVTTDREWRVLRGWDRTHEYDAAPELVETILGGHNARGMGSGDRLENGVYSFQFHPELANDPAKNDGRGTLPWLRYAIELAGRSNLWVASQRELYQRMADYQDIVFQAQADEVRVVNPTDRRIAEMVVEQRRAFRSVWDGDDELVHVVADRFVTVPPLEPGADVRLTFSPRPSAALRVTQPSNRGLKVLDARHDHTTGETRVLVSVCRGQHLRVDNVALEGLYAFQVDDEPAREIEPRVVKSVAAMLSSAKRSAAAGALVFLDLDVADDEHRFVERTVRIRRLPDELARQRRAEAARRPAPRTGRVTDTPIAEMLAATGAGL